MQREDSNIASNWIMVVDDERDLVSLFKDALESVGFHVYGFTDPLLALEHFTLNTGKGLHDSFRYKNARYNRN